MPPLPQRYNTPEMELEKININIQFLKEEQEMFGLMEKDQIKYDELIKQKNELEKFWWNKAAKEYEKKLTR